MITVNGKKYNEKDLSSELKNVLIARQEILNSKTRHVIELEKIDVLTDYYNKKIENMIKSEKPVEIKENTDGSDS